MRHSLSHGGGSQPQRESAALAEETPVGRLGSADEVAQLLVFLAGEGAGYITGQVISINGGMA